MWPGCGQDAGKFPVRRPAESKKKQESRASHIFRDAEFIPLWLGDLAIRRNKFRVPIQHHPSQPGTRELLSIGTDHPISHISRPWPSLGGQQETSNVGIGPPDLCRPTGYAFQTKLVSSQPASQRFMNAIGFLNAFYRAKHDQASPLTRASQRLRSPDGSHSKHPIPVVSWPQMSLDEAFDWVRQNNGWFQSIAFEVKDSDRIVATISDTRQGIVKATGLLNRAYSVPSLDSPTSIPHRLAFIIRQSDHA
jgi:hypothetical protein